LETRSLAEPRVLQRALLAAFITSAACWPRLAQWLGRFDAALVFWLVLFGAMFVLWAFVFGWHFKYSGRSVFNGKFQPKLWLVATLYAVAMAVVGHYFVDPQLRPVAPAEFPTDKTSWLAMSLSALALDPLYLCFAPFAFFIRLTRRMDVAWAATVAFGLFVLALRLGSPAGLPPIMLVVELLFLRVMGGFVSVWFYLRGGAPLVWWVILVLQLRYLFELAAVR
jgi:hypothetical protein